MPTIHTTLTLKHLDAHNTHSTLTLKHLNAHNTHSTLTLKHLNAHNTHSTLTLKHLNAHNTHSTLTLKHLNAHYTHSTLTLKQLADENGKKYICICIWMIKTYYTPAPRRGRGVYCFTSVRLSKIFFVAFFSVTWWQKSDIWSQASYRYTILWVAFLDPSDSYFLFADLVGLYTHW
jgi:hypothetical protein